MFEISFIPHHCSGWSVGKVVEPIITREIMILWLCSFKFFILTIFLCKITYLLWTISRLSNFDKASHSFRSSIAVLMVFSVVQSCVKFDTVNKSGSPCPLDRVSCVGSQRISLLAISSGWRTQWADIRSRSAILELTRGRFPLSVVKQAL